MSLSTTSQQIIVEQTAAHLTPQASYIFVGVFAVLCFASIIGQWLKRKNGADNATIANLNARIYAWWLMTLVLLGAFWFGKIGTVVLFFLISFAALREFYDPRLSPPQRLLQHGGLLLPATAGAILFRL